MLEKMGFDPALKLRHPGSPHALRIGQVRALQHWRKLVCVDGPVFTMQEVGEQLESFL